MWRPLGFEKCTHIHARAHTHTFANGHREKGQSGQRHGPHRLWFCIEECFRISLLQFFFGLVADFFFALLQVRRLLASFVLFSTAAALCDLSPILLHWIHSLHPQCSTLSRFSHVVQRACVCVCMFVWLSNFARLLAWHWRPKCKIHLPDLKERDFPEKKQEC